MAFILFLVTLYILLRTKVSDSSNILKSENFLDSILPLNAQLISIQRVPRNYISPCPEIFRYTFDGKKWSGLVVINNPAPRGSFSRIKIILSLGFHLSSAYIGEITLDKDRQKTVDDIDKGYPILYKLQFPLQNPIPKLNAIYYNGRLICTGRKEINQFVTTITLDHTLFTRPKSYFVKYPETIPAHPPTRITSTTTDKIKTTNNYDENLDFECGVKNVKALSITALILSSQVAYRGQFPWLAAYYHNGIVGDAGFICGGSLISTKLIITAAHCVRYKKDPLERKAEEASFYIGKHNLESLGEKNYIVSGVSQFIIHPDWDTEADQYDADIAIAVLYRTIPFTKFIKPICLWVETFNYDDIIGKKGQIGGWGRTEYDAISTSSPKWVEIPVVDLLTCIRSNSAFNLLTSDRTFCAGNRKGDSGPCSGDSGGGLVFQRKNKWFLRGIVSSSLYDQALATCDTKNYAVFTDVSKFTMWIRDLINSHG